MLSARFYTNLTNILYISAAHSAQLAKTMVHYFRLFPAYNVGEGFIGLSGSFYRRTIFGEETYPFDHKVTGRNIGNMIGLSFFYMFIVLMLEYSDDGGGGGVVGNVLRMAKTQYDQGMLRLYGVTNDNNDDGKWRCNDGLDEDDEEDADVAEEKRMIRDGGVGRMKGENAVLINSLWKIYPPSVGLLSNLKNWVKRMLGRGTTIGRQQQQQEGKPDVSRMPKRAVRGISAAVPKGECFGLLGVNGAGKTTTLGILTGEIVPTGGEAYVCGFDVGGSKSGASELAHARKHIGFCPQVDPLLELMTGRETLRMFANLRGNYNCEGVIEDLLVALGLRVHADKNAGAYSGGNKR